jgi:hypothetical protein
MHKYGESKTTRIMITTVPYVTFSSGQKISGRLIFVEQFCFSQIFGRNIPAFSKITFFSG